MNAGEALFFHGALRHAGVAVTRGTRYVLTLFVMQDDRVARNSRHPVSYLATAAAAAAAAPPPPASRGGVSGRRAAAAAVDDGAFRRCSPSAAAGEEGAVVVLLPVEVAGAVRVFELRGGGASPFALPDEMIGAVRAANAAGDAAEAAEARSAAQRDEPVPVLSVANEHRSLRQLLHALRAAAAGQPLQSHARVITLARQRLLGMWAALLDLTLGGAGTG